MLVNSSKDTRIASKVEIDETKNALYHLRTVSSSFIGSSEYRTVINVYDLGACNTQFEFIFSIKEEDLKKKILTFIINDGRNYDPKSFRYSRVASIKPICSYEFEFSHLAIMFTNGILAKIEFSGEKRKTGNSRKNNKRFYVSKEKILPFYRVNYVSNELIIDYKSQVNLRDVPYGLFGNQRTTEYIKLGNQTHDKIEVRGFEIQDKAIFVSAVESNSDHRKKYSVNFVSALDDRMIIKSMSNAKMRPMTQDFISFFDYDTLGIIKDSCLRVLKSPNNPSKYIYNKDPMVFDRNRGEKLDFDRYNSLCFYDSFQSQALFLPHVANFATTRGIQFYLKLRPIDSLALYLSYQFKFPPKVKESRKDIRRLINNNTDSEHTSFGLPLNDNKEKASKAFINELTDFLLDYGPLESAVALLQVLCDQPGEYFVARDRMIEMERKYKFDGVDLGNKDITREMEIMLKDIEVNYFSHLQLKGDDIVRPAEAIWREISNLYLYKDQDQKAKTENIRLNYTKFGGSFALDETNYMSVVNNSSFNQDDTAFLNLNSAQICPSLFLEASFLYLQRLLRPVENEYLFCEEIKGFNDAKNSDDIKPSFMIKDLNIIIDKLENLIKFLKDSNINSDYDTSKSAKNNPRATVMGFKGFNGKNEMNSAIDGGRQRKREIGQVYESKSKDYVLFLVDQWSRDNLYSSIEHSQYSNHELSLRKDLFSYIERSIEVLKACSFIIQNQSKLFLVSNKMKFELKNLNFSALLDSTKTDRLINKCLILILIHDFDNFESTAREFKHELSRFLKVNDIEFAHSYKKLVETLREEAEQSKEPKSQDSIQEKKRSKVEAKFYKIVERFKKYSLPCLEIIWPLAVHILQPEILMKMAMNYLSKIAIQKQRITKEERELNKRSEGYNSSKENCKVNDVRRRNAATLVIINEKIREVENLVFDTIHDLWVRPLVLTSNQGGHPGYQQERRQKDQNFENG